MLRWFLDGILDCGGGLASSGCEGSGVTRPASKDSSGEARGVSRVMLFEVVRYADEK